MARFQSCPVAVVRGDKYLRPRKRLVPSAEVQNTRASGLVWMGDAGDRQPAGDSEEMSEERGYCAFALCITFVLVAFKAFDCNQAIAAERSTRQLAALKFVS